MNSHNPCGLDGPSVAPRPGSAAGSEDAARDAPIGFSPADSDTDHMAVNVSL